MNFINGRLNSNFMEKGGMRLMNQQQYVRYHIDPKLYGEKGIQKRIDNPVIIQPREEDLEKLHQRVYGPFGGTKPSKATLERLIREGLNTSQIAERCQASVIRVQNWIHGYKINFKTLTAERLQK